MKNLVVSKHALMLVFAAALVSALPTVLLGQEGETRKTAFLNNPEKEACAKNLQRLYEAIQAYRKDHQKLPSWLSDLVPDYVKDPGVLNCSVVGQDANNIPYASPADPKIAKTYEYEFSDGTLLPTQQGGRLKMRELSSLQMGIIGGEVPLLRCLRHAPTLNISFDGHLFEAPLAWEDKFRDVVEPEQLHLPKLLAVYTNSSSQKLAPAVDKSTGALSDAAPDSLLAKASPNFELDLLDGGPFELAAHKGKDIIILDFWATWCGPCRAAFPDLIEVSGQYQNKGVILRAVDLRETPETVRAFLHKANLNLTVLMDRDGSVASLYRVGGIPQTVLVGKDGTVQAVHVGYDPGNKNRLRQELDHLLAGKPILPMGTNQP